MELELKILEIIKNEDNSIKIKTNLGDMDISMNNLIKLLTTEYVGGLPNSCDDAFYLLFKKAIEENKILVLDGYLYRGIGKSYFINYLSKILNIPVVYSFEYQSKIMREEYGTLCTCIDNVRGLKSKYLLCDGIKKDEVKKLRTLGYTVLGFCIQPKYDFI